MFNIKQYMSLFVKQTLIVSFSTLTDIVGRTVTYIEPGKHAGRL